MPEEAFELVRFHTQARRVPELIGKIGGWRVWGGPYSVSQLAGFGLVMFAGVRTWDLWPGTNSFAKVAVIVGASVAVMFAMRALPSGPLPINQHVVGLWKVATTPAWGRVGGRVVLLGRPRRTRYGRIVTRPTPQPTPAEPPERNNGPTGRRTMTAPPPLAPRPLTNIEQMLVASHHHEVS